MANHHSASKAHRQSLKRKKINNMRLSQLSTYLRKFKEYVKNFDLTQSIQYFNKAQSLFFRAVTKDVIKKNSARRKISKLHVQLKKVLNNS